jgi:hypothetical protein
MVANTIELTPWQVQLCKESVWDFSALRALYINCTLKRSPEVSNTEALADRSIAIVERNGVSVESIRAIDHDIATGVESDMTEIPRRKHRLTNALSAETEARSLLAPE